MPLDSDQPIKVPAGEFKARCLKLMDEVRRQRVEVVITKRGTPVAKLAPLDDRPPALVGHLKGSVTIIGDLMAPVGVPWEASGGGEKG